MARGTTYDWPYLGEGLPSLKGNPPVQAVTCGLSSVATSVT